MNFNRQDIKNWTVIYLNAIPTCLEMDNCRDCLTKLKDFECKWCAELNQCSTGTFRSRQDWLLKGCDVRKIKEVDNCPSPTTTYKEEEEEFNHILHVHSEETVTVSEMNAKQERPGTSPLERCKIRVYILTSGAPLLSTILFFVRVFVCASISLKSYFIATIEIQSTTYSDKTSERSSMRKFELTELNVSTYRTATIENYSSIRCDIMFHRHEWTCSRSFEGCIVADC